MCVWANKPYFDKVAAGQLDKANRAGQQTRKLRTYLGRVIRDIERKVGDLPQALQSLLEMAKRIHHQQPKTQANLQCPCPETECIAKAKFTNL